MMQCVQARVSKCRVATAARSRSYPAARFRPLRQGRRVSFALSCRWLCVAGASAMVGRRSWQDVKRKAKVAYH